MSDDLQQKYDALKQEYDEYREIGINLCTSYNKVLTNFTNLQIEHSRLEQKHAVMLAKLGNVQDSLLRATTLYAESSTYEAGLKDALRDLEAAVAKLYIGQNVTYADIHA